MKNILNSIKQESHQKAIITVSIIAMLTILALLLISMQVPNKKEVVLDTIDIESIEIEAFETEVPQEKTAVKKTDTNDSHQESSVLPSDDPTETKIDEAFGFKAGNNKGIKGELFGADDIDFVGPKGESKRNVITNPNISDNAQEEGDIALKLWVNANGDVVRTNYDASGSSSGSQYLIQLAKKAAKSMKYNSNDKKEIEFVGTIIFKFKKM